MFKFYICLQVFHCLIHFDDLLFSFEYQFAGLSLLLNFLMGGAFQKHSYWEVSVLHTQVVSTSWFLRICVHLVHILATLSRFSIIFNTYSLLLLQILHCTYVLSPQLQKGSFSVMCDSFATPWTLAYQAPPSMAFSRQ